MTGMTWMTGGCEDLGTRMGEFRFQIFGFGVKGRGHDRG
jgi:hypothetical protein